MQAWWEHWKSKNLGNSWKHCRKKLDLGSLNQGHRSNPCMWCVARWNWGSLVQQDDRWVWETIRLGFSLLALFSNILPVEKMACIFGKKFHTYLYGFRPVTRKFRFFSENSWKGKEAASYIVVLSQTYIIYIITLHSALLHGLIWSSIIVKLSRFLFTTETLNWMYTCRALMGEG